MDKEKSNITAESREILTKWLWADFMLYDHFKAKFMERMVEFGEERLAKKSKQLDNLNTRLRGDCVQLVAGKTNLTGEYRDNSPTVLGYKVDESKPMCILHGITEIAFVEQLRKKQLAKLKLLDKRHAASNYDAEEF